MVCPQISYTHTFSTTPAYTHARIHTPIHAYSPVLRPALAHTRTTQLQVLQHDTTHQYQVFRAWGRIGCEALSKHKLDPHPTVDEYVYSFSAIYVHTFNAIYVHIFNAMYVHIFRREGGIVCVCDTVDEYVYIFNAIYGHTSNAWYLHQSCVRAYLPEGGGEYACVIVRVSYVHILYFVAEFAILEMLWSQVYLT